MAELEFSKGMEFAIKAAMRICGVDRETITNALTAVDAVRKSAENVSTRLDQIEANQRRILAALGANENGETGRELVNGHKC